MPTTDLQKKDELRKELNLLQQISETYPDVELTDVQKFVVKNLNQRIEDIKKALED